MKRSDDHILYTLLSLFTAQMMEDREETKRKLQLMGEEKLLFIHVCIVEIFFYYKIHITSTNDISNTTILQFCSTHELWNSDLG